MSTTRIGEKLTAAKLRSLPGFDQTRHDSTLVDETVEVRNGKSVVVYRAKPEIVESATKEFRRRMELQGLTPF